MTEKRTTETKWPWLKQVNPKIFDVDRAPLLGNSPEFPWQALSSELAKLFEKEAFLVEPDTLQWCTLEEVEKRLPKPWTSAFIHLSGLEGIVHIAMHDADFQLLMSSLLAIPREEVQMQHAALIEGFEQFLLAAVLEKISKLSFVKELSLALTEKAYDIEDKALVFTQGFWITITDTEKNEARLFASLIMDSEFHTSWHSHFIQKAPDKTASLEAISVPISIEAGRTHISYEELKECSPGDCLLLDEVFFFPNSKHQEALLTLEGRAFCRVKAENGKLKIVQLPS